MKRCRVLFLVLFALDIMVLSTDGVWTRWFNLPKEFQGDYETLDRILTAFPRLVCDNPSGIEVQTSEGMPAAETGEVFHQYDAHGFICLDNQQDDGICNDYRIRFCCPGKFGAEMCHTEEEIANYTMAKNSSVSIREFNRFGISENNSAIVVANPLEASITEEFALAIHVHMMSEHTRAFGLTVHVTAVNDWPPYYNKSCETPIKDERSWPHIADLSLDGKKASYDDPNIDLSKQLRYVTNNSHCALDIYFGLCDTSALFPRRGTSNNDEISWYETEGKVTLLDQSHDVEIVKFDGGNTAHFGFKIIEVKEGKPIQNRMVKEVSEYMGLNRLEKLL
ncbi:uncharacterized protein [Ptychodera flava]|uniref:uncharacterized protein isoform X2 n=1 Tax=Ptychodera flava TaxID=63121 RepID=UPI00396A5519